MNEVGDLELNIMSCLLIKPELMNDIILKDEHFKKHQRLWQFMKAFYKKFKTFDIQLMYSVCKDKWHIVSYIQKLVEIEPTSHNFNKYQQRLIEQCNEDEKDKWFIDLAYELANKLYVRSITVDDFKNQIDDMYKKREGI